MCLSLRTEVLPEAMKRAVAIIAAVEHVEAEVTSNLVRMITRCFLPSATLAWSAPGEAEIPAAVSAAVAPCRSYPPPSLAPSIRSGTDAEPRAPDHRRRPRARSLGPGRAPLSGKPLDPRHSRSAGPQRPGGPGRRRRADEKPRQQRRDPGIAEGRSGGRGHRPSVPVDQEIAPSVRCRTHGRGKGGFRTDAPQHNADAANRPAILPPNRRST